MLYIVGFNLKEWRSWYTDKINGKLIIITTVLFFVDKIYYLNIKTFQVVYN